MEFQVGDKVFDTRLGYGYVESVLRGCEYPIGVQLLCGAFYSYTLDGKRFVDDDFVSLEFAEVLFGMRDN